MTTDHSPAAGAGAETGRPPTLGFCISVVIPNYNYGSFIGQAIDSALALDWPQVEVIVVDDGSTDDSRDVIARYAGRVVTILQENSGQAAACAAGFARAQGEVVIFLDSDDLLSPALAREIACVWRCGVSKVQFQMKTIDEFGADLGTVFPQYPICPSAQDIRRWVLKTSAYPTPPGSGNAYSRELLAKVFPLDGLSTIADSYFLAAAPFLGDVLTVPKPLVSYRVHGRNDGAFSALDVQRFAREVARSMQRFAYAQRIAAKTGVDLPDAARDRSLATLPYRVASFRLDPARHPMPGDSASSILVDAVRAAAYDQGVPWRSRLTLIAWTVLVLFAPAPHARQLVLWRFAPTTRPAFLRQWLGRLHIVGSSRA
jgi:glycosyltransferase involved in cell wall biosynthesis